VGISAYDRSEDENTENSPSSRVLISADDYDVFGEGSHDIIDLFPISYHNQPYHGSAPHRHISPSRAGLFSARSSPSPYAALTAHQYRRCRCLRISGQSIYRRSFSFISHLYNSKFSSNWGVCCCHILRTDRVLLIAGVGDQVRDQGMSMLNYHLAIARVELSDNRKRSPMASAFLWYSRISSWHFGQFPGSCNGSSFRRFCRESSSCFSFSQTWSF